jgi:hypothetical protein
MVTPNPAANIHEASSNQTIEVKPKDPGYTMPRWCPLGLTKTQKRKLQRPMNQEKVEMKLKGTCPLRMIVQ